MIHPHTELSLINENIGFGLVATRLIAAGTLTWVKDPLDMVFDASVYENFKGIKKDYLDKYCFIDKNGQYILCWDHGRFINHSCHANCIAPGFDFEIAVRDIHPGEQLTSDYGLFNMEIEFQCTCGGTGCRQTIRPTDPQVLHQNWDEKVRNVFDKINKLEQPLWEIVVDKESVINAIHNPENIPSCLNHYFAPTRI